MGTSISRISVKSRPGSSSSGRDRHTRQKNESYFHYENGRRFHNEDCPYPIPNDLSEIDRLDLQHYAIQYVCGKRYFAPIEDPKRAIDIGAGTGTWIMEMAVDFPGCHFLGVDVAPLQPTTVLPQNCSFELINVLKGIPKPDGWFDYVRQRLMIGAVPKDSWQDYLNECARVCASDGWIEVVEMSIQIAAGGPVAEQFNYWARGGFAARNVDVTLADKLDVFIKEAGFINVEKSVYQLPCGRWGGEVGQLFVEDLKLFISSLKPLFIKVFNISDEVIEADTEKLMKELEEHQAYTELYVYVGQKP